MRTGVPTGAADRREYSRPKADARTDAPATQSSTARQWEEEEQLRQIESLLTSEGSNDPNQKKAYCRELARFDLGHGLPGAWHVDAEQEAEGPSESARAAAGVAAQGPQRAGRSTIGPWTYLALLIGTTALVCGGSLLGWSMISGRSELWNLGLPIALGGQIALLAALLIQLERLWADHRRSAERIEKVNSQLHELQHTTTLLGTSATSPASQFYAHYAHGADAKVLLSDLKSQLDLLALRVSQQQGRST